MIALKYNNVTKLYDSKVAVDSFNAEINSGEIVALLGPNGSGKTTLMRITTGLLKPSMGDVIIFGKSITLNPIEAKRHIGYVPDEPFTYDVLSGFENVKFVADLWGVDLAKKKEELLRLSQILDMGSALDQVVSTYSAGMKRKLAFIMALIHDPELLVIDEITANLDPKALASIELLLSGLKKEGVAVVFSTHILEIAEVLADRIIIMFQGKKIWEGMARDIRSEAQKSKELKDLFFELTGGPEYEKIIEYLKSRRKE